MEDDSKTGYEYKGYWIESYQRNFPDARSGYPEKTREFWRVLYKKNGAVVKRDLRTQDEAELKIKMLLRTTS